MSSDEEMLFYLEQGEGLWWEKATSHKKIYLSKFCLTDASMKKWALNDRNGGYTNIFLYVRYGSIDKWR